MKKHQSFTIDEQLVKWLEETDKRMEQMGFGSRNKTDLVEAGLRISLTKMNEQLNTDEVRHT